MKHNGHIKIGALAQMCGLTIRTLHYYESIGLLVPGRSAKGYRLYSPEDILRLQQIIIQKTLGLPLEQIKSALDRPDFDYLQALTQQRQQLEMQIAQNRDQIRSIDKAIADINRANVNQAGNNQKGNVMAKKSLFAGFNPETHNAEVETRWGKTQAYKESHSRTSGYSGKDWALMKTELDDIWQVGARLMAEGVLPQSEAALSLAERHRSHIERWFYPCSPAMHCGLADMWVSDARFRENIDAHGAGLTDWIAEAIKSAV